MIEIDRGIRAETTCRGCGGRKRETDLVCWECWKGQTRSVPLKHWTQDGLTPCPTTERDWLDIWLKDTRKVMEQPPEYGQSMDLIDAWRGANR